MAQAGLFGTVWQDVDLGSAKGLSEVVHLAPSTVALDTLYRSKGEIPEAFLRGSGLTETFIRFIPSLLGKPFEFYSCFISYSSADEDFAERLYTNLQAKGVRCWFAPEDMKIGDRIRPELDKSIHLYDRLLLILSEASLAGQWIEQEVETTLEKERKQNSTVLFPIRIDDAVMEAKGGWPQLIRNTRHIGDFRNWKDRNAYQEAFQRLLRDLKTK